MKDAATGVPAAGSRHKRRRSGTKFGTTARWVAPLFVLGAVALVASLLTSRMLPSIRQTTTIEVAAATGNVVRQQGEEESAGGEGESGGRAVEADNTQQPIAVPRGSSDGVGVGTGSNNGDLVIEGVLPSAPKAPFEFDQDDEELLPDAQKKPQAPTDGPKLIWLLSFPNSGTSYTMGNAQTTSQKSVATNYDQEVNVVAPLFPNAPDNSPYLLDPSLPLPDKFILTKSHCVGHCEKCVPSLSPDEFATGCESLGTGLYRNRTYDSSRLVAKAIHLFRNPFDNLVAREHLGIKRRRVKWKWGEKRLSKFKDTPSGVRAWCRHADHIFKGDMEELMKERGVSKELYSRLPCHTDWWRYVQWHNNAIEVLERMQIPVQLLYYEDYAIKYNATVQQLFRFLELESVHPNLPFEPGKVYDNVYNDEIRYAATEFVQAIASPACWKLIKHYFEPWLKSSEDDGQKESSEEFSTPIANNGYERTDRPRPYVAWLVSYPNSGTSYTLQNTRAMTNLTTATNGGQEVKTGPLIQLRGGKDGVSDEDDDSKSPFLARPEMAVPKNLALTKAHCQGFCFDCAPAVDLEEFETSCRTASWSVPGTGGNGKNTLKQMVYSSEIVRKIVHLIRSPFDNAISRMHHAIAHQQQLHYSDKLYEKLTDPSKDLRIWCSYIDDKFSKYIPQSILERNDSEKLLSVPCHADFIRYVFWHNSVVQLSNEIYEVPSYILYYENYTSNFDGSVRELLDFLGQRAVSSPFPFESGKSYRDKFDARHIRDIAYLIRSLASDDCWKLIRHYFEGVPEFSTDAPPNNFGLEQNVNTATGSTQSQLEIAWLLSYPESVRPLICWMSSYPYKYELFSPFPFFADVTTGICARDGEHSTVEQYVCGN